MPLSEEQLAQAVEAAVAADPLTEEQTLENVAQYKKSMGDEEARGKFMANLQAVFDEADADKDGRLTEDEYIEYNVKLWAGAKDMGYHAP